MQRPAAPIRHGHEPLGVVAAFDRDQADCPGHPRVGDRENRLGGGERIEPEGPAHPSADRLARRLHVEPPQLAADRPLGIDPAEQEVGVGDGRAIATRGVAGGSRRGAGALRPHLQESAGIDPGDRTAARADRRDLDHGRAHDQAEVERRLRGQGRRAVAHEGDVEARAAHVAGDDVAEPGRLGDPHRRHDPGRGTAQDRVHGPEPSVGSAREATVRLDDRERRPNAAPVELALEHLEVAPDDGLQGGVKHRGRGPLELADLGQDLVARGDEAGLGPKAADDLGRTPLVGRVGVGVEEDDRDRPTALLRQATRRRFDLQGVDRLADLARGERPFADLEAAVARHDRREGPPEPPGPRPIAPAHLEHVAEPASREDPGGGDLALEHGVRADRRAMDEHLDRPSPSRACFQPFEETHGLAASGTRHLRGLDPATPLVEEDEVRKGPADIDADRPATAHPRTSRAAPVSVV